MLAVVTPLKAQQGKAVYDKWCAGCHGVDGKGQGPAAGYMLPRPRDFTQAQYQIRTTASGELPTDADIMRIIDEGMPGTAMPGWKDVLPESERRALVTYLKSFSAFFARQNQQPQPLSFGRPPGVSDEGLAEGRQVYDRLECWKCHGRAGRGDGPSAPTQEDDDGHPIRPTDLTEPWYFNGGSTVEEIYRRFSTGLDGTPMPSFTDLIEANVVTEEQLWRVAQYVRSLAPEKIPEVRDVVRADQVSGELPATVDDSLWNQAEKFYIPLVGQIIIKPRWFSPTVDGVWVQALHNGNELAIRLTWHDPSRSPDPVWSDWQRAVTAMMEPREDGAAGGQGVTAAGDTAAPASGSPPDASLPDAIALQFPRRLEERRDPPYFLMGSTREPVYIWTWRSDQQGAAEATARGMTSIEPFTSGQQLTAHVVFDQGEWRVMLRRPLLSADSANRLSFVRGRPIPMAIFAWDGNNGEQNTRGSISTWYYIYLTEPTPKTVYATPVLATVLTAGLGLLLVVRAQKREKSKS